MPIEPMPSLNIREKHASEHTARPEFTPYVEGQRALILEDECGAYQGELVWRLAHTRHGIAEITGFGIAEEENRRKGYGSQMLEAAVQDVRAFMQQRGITPRLIYLFTNERNGVARSFYEARGFAYVAGIPGFYENDIACLYVRRLDLEESI